MKPRENQFLFWTAAASAGVTIAVGSLLGSWSLPSKLQQRLTLRVKTWILSVGPIRSTIDQELIVLPPRLSITDQEKNASRTDRSRQEEYTHTLLIIFPGANIPAQDYVAIGEVVQELAAKRNLKLVVGIAPYQWTCTYTRTLINWALNGNDPTVIANLVQKKAEQSLGLTNNATTNLQDVYNPMWKSSVFPDIFLWGHSMGGFFAVQAGYASKYRAVLLYGCSMSLIHNRTAKSQPLPTSMFTSTSTTPSALLASFPRPVLTLMAERDGLLRPYCVSQEAQELSISVERTIKCSTQPPEVLKRKSQLHKPVIILADLNHLQMAMGALPQRSLLTGRSDFVSPVSLNQAHDTIARVALDFLQQHSTICPSTKDQQNRLVQLGNTTQTVYLAPFLRLTNSTYQCQFLTYIQRQLLHVTADGKHPFHFYEEDYDETSHEDYSPQPDIIPQWHAQPKDFLYSKSTWDADHDQIVLPILEQDPIQISSVAQQSKTLAFKGRSQAAILFNQNKYHEIKDSPAPTLMELNQQTFDRTLQHLVTPAQKRRYLSRGKQLRFGPDILVPMAPHWVKQPVSITKLTDGSSSYYLWQSTYTSTPISMPPPFGGAWYGKPLSPAQAYEWIVFDAFKS